MAKLNIKSKIILKDQVIEEEVLGSFESGVISYQEKNNTYVYIDINRNELIRENDELTMKYIFSENELTKGYIYIKELNQDLELDIKTKLIEKDSNKYKVEYIEEEETFVYEIEYAEVENELFKTNRKRYLGSNG